MYKKKEEQNRKCILHQGEIATEKTAKKNEMKLAKALTFMSSAEKIKLNFNCCISNLLII